MRHLRTIPLYFVLLSTALTAPAAAHPLGNFTINHLSLITTSSHRLHVHYVLDIAEIPTFQIMHDGSATWNDADLQRWARRETAVVLSALQIRVNGENAALQLASVRAALRPGAGGLPILRWVGEFGAPVLAVNATQVRVVDRVYADRRIGWKDIVLGSETEPTNDLRNYPSALIGTPRRITSMAFVVENGTARHIAKASDSTPALGPWSSWYSPNVLSDLFARPDQTPLFILLTILAAFGLGALHALEPGHGKALLAFTLVGARATTRQAIILAASLTFAHTAAVVILGIVLFFAAGFVSETVYPWITLLSGIAIAVIGARSLARYVAARRGSRHVHDNGQGANHTHTHSHAVPGTQPLKFKSAVIAAMSGGIAPCPAAIVVLLAALRLHQVGYGIVLIVIFSLGLAGVLSGLGIAVVLGAEWLSRRSSYSRFVEYGPLFTALVISTIGAWTLSQGFIEQGVNAPAPLLGVLALLAIAGYALSSHGHLHSYAHIHTEHAA